MSLRNTKLFLGLFILLAYISIGVFGLLQFSHTTQMDETPMVNCPYTQNGYSICENTLSHINNWRQFSNTTFSSLFIFTLFILGIILYFYNKQNFLKQNQYFYKWKYYLYDKKLYTHQERIIKWLALFENSPSLI